MIGYLNQGDGSSISGTKGYIPYFSDSKTLVDSGLYYDGSNLGIGNSDPSYALDVTGAIRSSKGLRGLTSSGANTGCIGECLSMSNTGSTMAQGTVKSLAAVTITKGIWELRANIRLYQDTELDTDNYICGIITSNKSLFSDIDDFMTYSYCSITATPLLTMATLNVTPRHVDLIGTSDSDTVYYLLAVTDFATDDDAIKAYLSATRIA